MQKLPVFYSFLGYLLKLPYRCGLPRPRSPRRQGISAVKSHCVVQSVSILTVHEASMGFSTGYHKRGSLYNQNTRK